MEKIDSLEPEVMQLVYVGEFYITMYAATVEQCGNDLGITASGRKVTDNPECHTVAVDPSVIPLGSYLKNEGWPDVYRADDTGSAIQGFDIDDFDALTPAMEAGSAKSVNIVLMGHFAKHTDIPKERWIAALKKVVKPQFIDMNLKAFDLGYGA